MRRVELITRELIRHVGALDGVARVSGLPHGSASSLNDATPEAAFLGAHRAPLENTSYYEAGSEDGHGEREPRVRVCFEALPPPWAVFGIPTAVVALGTYVNGMALGGARQWRRRLWLGSGLIGVGIAALLALVLLGLWWPPLCGVLGFG